MENIEHKTLFVNGINMHVAEIGKGPAVLFLHGFPSLWYTWRHQMLYLSSKGYRAIAPDLRGYGDTDAPPDAASYTVFHIVGDLVALLDALELDQVFLVGHDWGAYIAWFLCLLRPDRIKALLNLSIVFRYPRHITRKPVEVMRELFGDDYYVCRFQEAGEMEEVFGQVDTAQMLRALMSSRDPSPPVIPRDVDLRPLVANPPPIPPWLAEEDVLYYASKFSKKGFSGPLNYYRALDLNWELSAPWRGSQIEVPVKFIVGELDATYHVPGVKEYIHEGGFKEEVPDLQEIVVMEGVAHFLQLEKPHEINAHILNFIANF